VRRDCYQCLGLVSRFTISTGANFPSGQSPLHIYWALNYWECSDVEGTAQKLCTILKGPLFVSPSSCQEWHHLHHFHSGVFTIHDNSWRFMKDLTLGYSRKNDSGRISLWGFQGLASLFPGTCIFILNRLPSSMSTTMLNLSIPDVLIPAPWPTFTKSRLQAKPATLLILNHIPLFAVKDLTAPDIKVLPFPLFWFSMPALFSSFQSCWSLIHTRSFKHWNNPLALVAGLTFVPSNGEQAYKLWAWAPPTDPFP